MSMPTLPNEVWLEVFSFLDYSRLKTCQRVCKRFRALTECASLDKQLFRPCNFTTTTDWPLDFFPASKLHLALRLYMVKFGTPAPGVIELVGDGISQAPPLTAIQDELALLTAMTTLEISHLSSRVPINGDRSVTTIRNPQGVTVGDTLNAIKNNLRQNNITPGTEAWSISMDWAGQANRLVAIDPAFGVRFECGSDDEIDFRDQYIDE